MRPENALEAAEDLIRHARMEWRRFEGECASSALPTMRSAALDGRVSTSGHSDPTASQIESHAPYYEAAAITAEILGLARELVKRQTQTRGRSVDISAEVNAARCDGVVGDDPSCTRNAVRDPTFKGARHPTCWSCLSRRRRLDERAEAS